MASQPPKNHVRRAAGAVVCLSPLALLASSVIAALSDKQGRTPFAAFGFVAIALAFAALNFYLSFIRPWWVQRRSRNPDVVRCVSGIPLVGTVFIVLSVLFGFGALGTSLVGFVALLLDTGGTPWLLVITWRDPSSWDSSEGGNDAA